jgi:hypothetical protein
MATILFTNFDNDNQYLTQKIFPIGIHKFTKNNITGFYIPFKIRVTVFTGKNFDGDSYIFENSNQKIKFISSNDLFNYGLYKNIGSIIINLIPNIPTGNHANYEHFKNQKITDTCHYVCDSFDSTNVITILIIILIIYILINKHIV